jgi:hypothetical protein
MESLSNPRRPHAQEFVTAQANSLSEKARGGREEATRCLGQAGLSLEEPHIIDRVRVKEAATICSPRRPQPLEG